jgi:hypothetical protein
MRIGSRAAELVQTAPRRQLYGILQVPLMHVAPRTEQAGASPEPLQQGPLSAPQALHEPLLHTAPTAEQVPASAAPPGQQASFNKPQVMPLHIPF